MYSGRYSYKDLELLFGYLKKHCEGNYTKFAVKQNGTLVVSVRNRMDEELTIEIYEECTQLFPKIIKEDRLTNVL